MTARDQLRADAAAQVVLKDIRFGPVAFIWESVRALDCDSAVAGSNPLVVTRLAAILLSRRGRPRSVPAHTELRLLGGLRGIGAVLMAAWRSRNRAYYLGGL